MASTNDFDFHAPHWHGNTVILNGMRTDYEQFADELKRVGEHVRAGAPA
jgi:hypothetical protein